MVFDLRHSTLLGAGENRIAATVLFIGGDGQNHVTGCPGAVVYCALPDAETEQNGVSLPIGIAASALIRDTSAAHAAPRAAHG